MKAGGFDAAASRGWGSLSDFMVALAKGLTHRIVIPAFMGSNPICHPNSLFSCVTFNFSKRFLLLQRVGYPCFFWVCKSFSLPF